MRPVPLAFKVRNEPRVAVTVVGDGGSSKGDFYGAINVAGAMQLPLVAVIVNNQWAISVPRNADGREDARAKRHRRGPECLQVDGNDLIAMRTAMDFAIKRARHHGGMVIEAVTYRLSDHTTADDARRYRPDDEVKAAWQREPLKRMRPIYRSTRGPRKKSVEGRMRGESRRRGQRLSRNQIATDRSVFDYTWANSPPTSPRSAPRRSGRMSENTSDAWAYHDLLFPDRCDGECDGERSQVRQRIVEAVVRWTLPAAHRRSIFIDGQKQKVGLVTGPADSEARRRCPLAAGAERIAAIYDSTTLKARFNDHESSFSLPQLYVIDLATGEAAAAAALPEGFAQFAKKNGSKRRICRSPTPTAAIHCWKS
jgi:hypothetical protein